VGGAGSGVGDPPGDQPVTVGDPEIHQQVAAGAGVGTEAAPLRLSLVEREEISRGLAGGESLCSIARGLGRAPSTISREVRSNGGARGYRVCRADRDALRRARRPKRAKLAQCEAPKTLQIAG
jgi:Helix-turn-helix domain